VPFYIRILISAAIQKNLNTTVNAKTITAY
jgi:hypothetical protein